MSKNATGLQPYSGNPFFKNTLRPALLILFSWKDKARIQEKTGNLPARKNNTFMNRIEQLETFLLQNPNDAFLNHALALEYVKAEKYGEAKAAFLKNADHHPDYVPTYFHLGKLYEKMKLYPEALQCYETGIEKAQKAGDRKTAHELRIALEFLEDDLEDGSPLS